MNQPFIRRIRRTAKMDCKLCHVCLSVRPSARVEQLGFHQTDFREIWYLSISRKSVNKIQVLLKSDKNIGYFTRRPIYFFIISLSSS